MTAAFVSHARTPEELKAELLGDIRRRMELLDHYSQVVAKSAVERAQIARVQMEFKAMFLYWDSLVIDRPKRKRRESFATMPLVPRGEH